MIIAEKTIHVFKGPICGFRVKEVNYRNKRSVENRPDDIKFPVKGLDANCFSRSALLLQD